MKPCFLWTGAPCASHLDGSPIWSSIAVSSAACTATLPRSLAAGAKSHCGRTMQKVCRFHDYLYPEGFVHPGKQLLFQWDNFFFKEVRKCLESSVWAGGAASILYP